MKFKIMKKLCMVVGILVVCSMAGTMKDPRDGNTYRTVEIGNQVWMAENMNYKTGDSWCYDNEESNCKKYGRLYTWQAAMNACPDGWHLPGRDEFKSLLDTVGTSERERSLNLRSKSWEKGSNKYGFSALPAGAFINNPKKFKKFIGFRGLGSETMFWAFETFINSAYELEIRSGFNGGAAVHKILNVYGLSVRCLQDSNEGGDASSSRSEAQTSSGTLEDSRDGNTYKTVKIGEQTWMAEHLNYETSESSCYDNKESNCKKYGRLYTWQAAMNACPSGWHLPSKEEMVTFIETVKARVKQIVTQKKLNAEPWEKQKWFNHLRDVSWNGGFDSFGFSVLPAGTCCSLDDEFFDLGYDTVFWSSKVGYGGSAALGLNFRDSDADFGFFENSSVFSVRCLKN